MARSNVASVARFTFTLNWCWPRWSGIHLTGVGLGGLFKCGHSGLVYINRNGVGLSGLVVLNISHGGLL